MLSILDRYILKRYLGSFALLLLLFLPIMVTVHIAEKIGKIIAKDAPLGETLIYLGDFTMYFTNFLFPIFLFISTMFFTSKLANNTEVIAFLSSGVSFNRFLRPYIIGATLVCVTALLLSAVFVPKAAEGFNEFQYKYFKRNSEIQSTNVFRQINDNEYVYVSNYQPSRKLGYDFTLEHFEDNVLKHKIYASRITFKDSTYTLSQYKKRVILDNSEIITKKSRFDTLFDFEIGELTPVSYAAEVKSFTELNDFIEQEERRGNANMNIYYVEKYKRITIPISAFIFTIIAVAVSSIKKRGGMGVNLAIGIVIAMTYMFMDKVFGTIAEKSTFSPLIAVWTPNIFFAIVAIFLLRNARR
ncbi:LptF/LptG family permease [Nonlabens ponticola]|uniref:YjgP/YjgQ family permease n=1 Tax=Nonlabens ponticola TaxID=2496866 RepID=A0A3S9N0N0_9FLAO|nr:LptF/LptG family permease [Nonlabens ponticola]AZQ44882.1 YjgP/YjgQ family permease [Nonlabens ponticola]